MSSDDAGGGRREARVMNERVAFVQNGREVSWREVTNEDLLATICGGSDSDAVLWAQREWTRRMGQPYGHATRRAL